MKKIISSVIVLLLLACLCGCSDKSLLSAEDPVALTMWHVYGEQADSPMNRLVQEFNETVGLEKGIVINVTALSNSSNIGPMLRDAMADVPGSGEMPDLFFCHASNAQELGIENLLDWREQFSDEELDGYIDDFLEDGVVDDTLVVFPVSKSTHMLFVNGTQFDLFAADTGVSYDDLATWEGFFTVAEKYYEWSGGKTFCALDYLLRAVELNAMSAGNDISMAGNWYDFSDPDLKDSWMEFAQSLTQGHIMVSDLYSNTQVMTGEVIAGLSSCAAILYYNDTVTYPDNTSEPLDLRVFPMPVHAGGAKLATQAGVGLCALKTTDKKAEAAAVFAAWLTEGERNLEFVTNTGYMPVTEGAFESISSTQFTNAGYANLYSALDRVQREYTLVKEPNFVGYYDKAYTLYAVMREKHPVWKEESQTGTDAESLKTDSWEIFSAVK